STYPSSRSPITGRSIKPCARAVLRHARIPRKGGKLISKKCITTEFSLETGKSIKGRPLLTGTNNY
ncbi:MAG: hypothetical protein KJ929_04790, partial [Euryarchaeota archaeon]|nr:hypothetical protein [Euryarchaeota archaeon]